MNINIIIVISVIGFVALTCMVIHALAGRGVPEVRERPAAKKYIEIYIRQGVQAKLLLAYLIRRDGDGTERKNNIGYVDLCKFTDEDVLNFIKAITAERLPVVVKKRQAAGSPLSADPAGRQ